jgi:hypothetical protein
LSANIKRKEAIIYLKEQQMLFNGFDVISANLKRDETTA